MVQINFTIITKDGQVCSTCISAHSLNELRTNIIEFERGITNLYGNKVIWDYKKSELLDHDIVGKAWAILLGLIPKNNHEKKQRHIVKTKHF